MKLGDRVRCTAYIKPTGNHYEITSGQWLDKVAIGCTFWGDGAEEGVEVEDFHCCDRFRIIERVFTGVFVGVTIRNTRLNVEYDEPTYGNAGYFTHCDQPERFAVVYFANNQKRLVPLDMVEVMG